MTQQTCPDATLLWLFDCKDHSFVQKRQNGGNNHTSTKVALVSCLLVSDISNMLHNLWLHRSPRDLANVMERSAIFFGWIRLHLFMVSLLFVSENRGPLKVILPGLAMTRSCIRKLESIIKFPQCQWCKIAARWIRCPTKRQYFPFTRSGGSSDLPPVASSLYLAVTQISTSQALHSPRHCLSRHTLVAL